MKSMQSLYISHMEPIEGIYLVVKHFISIKTLTGETFALWLHHARDLSWHLTSVLCPTVYMTGVSRSQKRAKSAPRSFPELSCGPRRHQTAKKASQGLLWRAQNGQKHMFWKPTPCVSNIGLSLLWSFGFSNALCFQRQPGSALGSYYAYIFLWACCIADF